MVNLKINNKEICVPEGTSILEAAKQNKIKIPTLCYLKDINEIGACRICLVEIKGKETLVASCNTEVEEGMEVFTNSQKVHMARMTNIQLILARHNTNCPACTRNGNCVLQDLGNGLARGPLPFKRSYTHEP